MKNLTIVVPVYNTEKSKLERCFRSILKDDRIKIIVYNDASDQPVIGTINDLISKTGNMDRTTILIGRENVGLGKARNICMNHITDGYVIFLDSDDELTLTKSDVDYIFLNDNKIVAFNIDLVKNNEVVSTEKIYDFNMQRMIPYFITPIAYNINYLRDKGIKFDESRRIFEDIVFSVKLWINIIKDDGINIDMWYRDKSIYRYHIDGESLTRGDIEKSKKMIEDYTYWIDWIKSYYDELDLKKTYGNELIRAYLYNRLRYETVNLLGLKMKVNGILDEYKPQIRDLSPYNMTKIFRL